jgi:polyferredoxin
MVATNVLLSILWGRWFCNHPQEDLTKFGYMSKKKIKKFKHLPIFWQHAIIYVLHSISNFFFIGGTFFPDKSLYMSDIGFFSCFQDAKFQQTKQNKKTKKRIHFQHVTVI